MAVNYTPITNGLDADDDTFNGPLEELDTAIENQGDGTKAMASPTIQSFVNSVHDHESDAGGGKLTIDALQAVGEPAGQVIVTDGSNGFVLGSGPGLPIGAVIPYAGSSAPSGWLLCAGQAVSRTTYADLFALIGSTYGAGDGSTTFNVPDLRGRFPLGKDDMGGSSANRVTATQADNLGQGSGAENHTLVTGEIPAHAHTGDANTTGSTGVSGNVFMRGLNGGATITTNNAGGGGAHNNMPPYLTLNYIIKT